MSTHICVYDFGIFNYFYDIIYLLIITTISDGKLCMMMNYYNYGKPLKLLVMVDFGDEPLQFLALTTIFFY